MLVLRLKNFTPFSSKHLCMRKGAIQFCFKLLICGIEWETFMGEVECKLLERDVHDERIIMFNLNFFDKSSFDMWMIDVIAFEDFWKISK